MIVLSRSSRFLQHTAIRNNCIYLQTNLALFYIHILLFVELKILLKAHYISKIIVLENLILILI